MTIHNDLITPSRRTIEEPVFSEDALRALAARLLGLLSGDFVSVYIDHTARQVTRFANNRVMTTDDGDELNLRIIDRYGQKQSAVVSTNQLDETTLRRLVTDLEHRARTTRGVPKQLHNIPIGRQHYLPVALWRGPTVAAFQDRPSVAESMIAAAREAGLSGAGFVGLMARSGYRVMKNDGLEAYYRETDCEVTMTARTPDGRASGWYGQAHRDWSRIRPAEVAREAVAVALRSRGAQALEPGRRIAILGPLAVVQLVRHMSPAFSAKMTYDGGTPFHDRQYRTKLGQRLFDPRIMMASDPTDPESGYRPDFSTFGLPEPRMTWVDRGVLVNLAYEPDQSIIHGKEPAAGWPWSFSLHAAFGADGTAPATLTIDEMIASCREGIYVHHVSSIEPIDSTTGLITGVTRDGCFLVKNGKIDRPVKNFRFAESPWFFLNNLIAIGKSERAAFGYTPRSGIDWTEGWPRRPMIVPPLMVRDFNFTQLADAV